MFDVTLNKQFLRNLSGVFVCCPVELPPEQMEELDRGPLPPAFGGSQTGSAMSSRKGTRRTTGTCLDEEESETEEGGIFQENL